MKLLVLEAWCLLIRFEFIMRFREFKELHRMVRGHHARPKRTNPISAENLCHAMDLACVLYFKSVLCLQRSAATTLLLRRHGWNAELIIGAQILPFKSHAWCEIEGIVVNDKPYIANIYAVLERC